MKKSLSILMLLTLCLNAEEYKTKLDEINDKKGIVIIKGYSSIDNINGLYGGVLNVSAKDFLIVEDKLIHTTGLSIAIKEIKHIDKDISVFIDSEEIDDLIEGINSLAKVSKKITYLKDFEASYKTKGGFEVTIFNKENGDTGVLVKTIKDKEEGKIFLSKEGLLNLNEIIKKGKNNLKI